MPVKNVIGTARDLELRNGMHLRRSSATSAAAAVHLSSVGLRPPSRVPIAICEVATFAPSPAAPVVAPSAHPLWADTEDDDGRQNKRDERPEHWEDHLPTPPRQWASEVLPGLLEEIAAARNEIAFWQASFTFAWLCWAQLSASSACDLHAPKYAAVPPDMLEIPRTSDTNDKLLEAARVKARMDNDQLFFCKGFDIENFIRDAHTLGRDLDSEDGYAEQVRDWSRTTRRKRRISFAGIRDPPHYYEQKSEPPKMHGRPRVVVAADLAASVAAAPLRAAATSNVHKASRYADFAVSHFDNPMRGEGYQQYFSIMAPGSAITSAWHNSDSATNSISGTSMACPHVSGAAALLSEPDYTLNSDQILAMFTEIDRTDLTDSLPFADDRSVLSASDHDSDADPTDDLSDYSNSIASCEPIECTTTAHRALPLIG